jgi:hypothetical protein
MPDEISPGARKKLDVLCDKLGIADGEPDVRAEILGHLEEKLSGYLSGEEKLTEDDALLLVERHFGDLRKIGRELQSVNEAGQFWAYRLIPPLFFSSVCRVAQGPLALALAYLYYPNPHRPEPTHADWLHFVRFLALPLVIITAVLFRIAFTMKLPRVFADAAIRKTWFLAGGTTAILFGVSMLLFWNGDLQLFHIINFSLGPMELLFWLLLVDRGRGSVARTIAAATVFAAFLSCLQWPLIELGGEISFPISMFAMGARMLPTSVVYIIATRIMRWARPTTLPAPVG